MSSSALTAALRELVAALNGGDADTARACTADGAWNGGPVPLERLCGDEKVVLQAAPLLLQTGQRAAARLVATRTDESRESTWLLFEERADGWYCVEATRTRLDAEAFLIGHRPARTPPPAPARAASPPSPAAHVASSSPVDAGLIRSVERLVGALETGDTEVGRSLTDEGRWDAKGDSPARLFKHVAKSPSDVTALEWRIRGDRAAVRLVLSAAWGTEDVWSVWRQRGGRGWKLLAVPAAWETAGLFLLRVVDEVPFWGTLAPDAGAARWGQALIAAALGGGAPPPDVPEAAFAQLGKPPGSAAYELRLGETVSLSAVGRAMVQFEVVEPHDEFVIESRWAVLERESSDDPWRFRRTASVGSFVGLLDGISVPTEPKAPLRPPTAEEEAARRALRMAVQEVLAADGRDADSFRADGMSTEQLRAFLRAIVGEAFGAFFAATLSGALDGSSIGTLVGPAEPTERPEK